MAEIKVSVSELITFMRDPLRWKFRYIDRRVPRREPVALAVGTLWHHFLETRELGGSVEQALARVSQELDTRLTYMRASGWLDDADKLEKEYGIIATAGPLWVDSPPVETLHVETALERRLEKNYGDERFGDLYYTLVGTPDRVVRHNGSLWHVQNRSLSPSTPMALYLDCAERDLHERVYAWLIQHAFPGERYAGTMFDILRKLSPKSIIATPGAAMGRHFVPINPALVADAISEIGSILEVMTMVRTEDLRPWSNPTLDKGLYGNSRDAYTDVMLGRVSLHDDAYFMDAVDRYEPVAPEA